MDKEKLALYGGKPVRQKKIYYGHQYIDVDDINAVVKVLKSDFLTCGPEVERLEEKICKITGAKYAVVVSNGTAALQAACYAAGVDEGNEVITTPMTFAASANCVLYLGAVPVFVDINRDTYNLDPQKVAEKITGSTKAVIAVDFTGQPAELDKFRRICKDRELVFIEDASHAIGGSYQGQKIGNIADLTTFSFHPVKTVTAGEGGAIVTNNREYYEKLILFRSHGITRNPKQMSKEPEGGWYYEQTILGYNLRMTDIQAALCSSQLDKLVQFKERRNQITEKYNAEFQEVPELILQKEIEGGDTARHLYIIQLNFGRLKAGRKEIFEALEAENVCCNVHYIPVYYFPYYQNLGYHKGLCPNAEALYERIITIPLYPGMTDGDVSDVIKAIKKVIQYFKK